MTTDDIIRMAREVGISVPWDQEPVPFSLLERFAALVSAAEREKVSVWMIQRSYATGHGDTTEDLLQELEWQVRESEREACAKVCEKDFSGHGWAQAAIAAQAIRERGKP